MRRINQTHNNNFTFNYLLSTYKGTGDSAHTLTVSNAHTNANKQLESW